MEHLSMERTMMKEIYIVQPNIHIYLYRCIGSNEWMPNYLAIDATDITMNDDNDHVNNRPFFYLLS